LIGKQGTGKTTVSKILCNKIAPNNYLYINASDENNVDTVRNKVKSFASSIGFGGIKIIHLDECLEENEKIQIGTPENYEIKKLNELEKGVIYPIVSVNLKTRKKEADYGIIISDKEDDVYEVELEDGRKIKMTNNHPFIIETNDGKLIQKQLKDLTINDEIISF
jgi:intein/homing endonuclease